jgi:hypothetical protein
VGDGMIPELTSGIGLFESGLSVMQKVYKLLDFADPEGRNITFSYSTEEMEITTLLSIPKGPKRWIKNKIRLHYPGIKNISLKNLPQFTDSNAIIMTNEGYYLDTGKLGDDEKFLLTIKHEAPCSLMRDLISVQNSNIPMNYDGGIEEYWLSVALKKRDILDKAFSGFNIYGFENHFTINIHNSVATTIPQTFIKRLINISKFIHTTDREEMHKIVFERLRQQKQKKKQEDERKIIMDLRNCFCTSSAFLKFLKIDRPFIYKEAYPGKNYYDKIPFDVFPKTMEVVSATNIDFDHPTSEGKLSFKKITFEDNIKTFFETPGY